MENSKSIWWGKQQTKLGAPLFLHLCRQSSSKPEPCRFNGKFPIVKELFAVPNWDAHGQAWSSQRPTRAFRIVGR